MRLKILNSGYGFGTKVLFAFIHTVSRHPVPDAAKLVFYRPDFYGTRAKEKPVACNPAARQVKMARGR